MRQIIRRFATTVPIATLLLLAPAAHAAGESASTTSGELAGSYSYVRTLEGTVILYQAARSAEGEAQAPTQSNIDVNQPLLAGDRLEVGSKARAEIVLSDRSVLRLDGDTDLVLDHLAGSPDTDDRTTVLRLIEGNLQLVVPADALGSELPRIDTPNATFDLQAAGTYRVTSAGDDWSEIVARSGNAQVLTPSGSDAVESGEEAIVEGTSRPSIEVAEAGARDAVESWGDRLDRLAAQADTGAVDSSLSYSAAGLGDYGSWVDVDGQNAWQPRVASDWRPYWQGRWDYTPSGLTWVSSEPWGWVPYHYGSWDYAPGYGWVWYPGDVYAPAWVYWYWGPSYTGWCPVGYYSHYYGRGFPRHGFGADLRFGVYGWAGGAIDPFFDWTFVPSLHFGHRDSSRYYRTGRSLRNELPHDGLARGIITTDTRRLSPERLRRPGGALDVLRSEGQRFDRTRGDGDLPDVTRFVARQRGVEEGAARQALGLDGARDGKGGPPRALRLDRGGAPRGAEASRNVISWRDLKGARGTRQIDRAGPLRSATGERVATDARPATPRPRPESTPVRPAEGTSDWRSRRAPTPEAQRPRSEPRRVEAPVLRRVTPDADASWRPARPAPAAENPGNRLRQATPDSGTAWRERRAEGTPPAREPVVRRVIQGLRDGDSPTWRSPIAEQPPRPREVAPSGRTGSPRPIASPRPAAPARPVTPPARIESPRPSPRPSAARPAPRAAAPRTPPPARRPHGSGKPGG